MNIAVCINTLSAGGAETFAVDLAIKYAKSGNKVIVVVHNILDKKGVALKKSLQEEGIPFYNVEVKRTYEKLFLPYKYARIFRKHQIDVIHSHLEQTDTYTLLSKLFYTRPLLVRTLHSKLPFSKYPYWIHKLLFAAFKLNFGCGEDMVNEYKYSGLRAQLIPINNGISIDNRSIKEKESVRELYRSRHGIANTDIVFLQIGTMSPRFGGILTKGHDLSIAALNQIQVPNIKFIFVGDCTEINNSKLYNQDYASDPRIIYTGIVDNVKDYIQMSDVILAPSRTEGLPISTMECVVEGKPLICSSIKQFDIFNSPATLSFDISNPSALYNAIQLILDEYELYLKEAQCTMMRYIGEFSINKTASTYLRYISELSNQI